MSRPKNFTLFVFAGLLELVVGLGFSIFIGLTHSWLYGLLLAGGFFISANLMFLLAWRKLEQ